MKYYPHPQSVKLSRNNLHHHPVHLLRILRTKRDIDDEIQIDQPTSKQPRHRSPSHNPSSSLEPQQLQSPPLNDEDSDPPPILNNDGKRQQQQQDDTRDNKKQKHQENAILLTITETPLPQLITLSDYVPTPTDSLLETLAIPTPPQIIPQPQITESTTNETTVNYTNQEQTTTRTHGFEHHSPPTSETPPESPSKVSEISATSQLISMQFPDNWSQMSRRAKKSWTQSHKTNPK